MVVIRASESATVMDNFRAWGDAQASWVRKYMTPKENGVTPATGWRNPLMVIANVKEEGYGIAVPLNFHGDVLYASTGTYRYYGKMVDAVVMERLRKEAWNGYYYLPVKNPHSDRELVLTASRA